MSKRKRTDDDVFVLSPDRRMGNLKGCLIMTLTGMIRKASDDDLHALFAATISRNGNTKEREGQTMQVIERKVKVAVGLNDMARKLGCSRGHLSLVIHGHRKSKRLEGRLSKMGYKVKGAA